MPDVTLPPFLKIAPDVVLGENVRLNSFVNLYVCTIGGRSMIGAFAEIQRDVYVGEHCRAQSHLILSMTSQPASIRSRSVKGRRGRLVHRIAPFVQLKCLIALVSPLLLGFILNLDPFDLIERDLIAGAIVELRCTWAFVRRHGLCVFERAAALKIGCDARGAERVAANLALNAQIGGASLDHAPGVDAVHRGRCERAGAAGPERKRGVLFSSRMPAASI